MAADIQQRCWPQPAAASFIMQAISEVLLWILS